jgi:uncharacterized membrane protein YvbJ
MFCSNCGSQIQTELNFCSRCGTKVSKIDSETQKSVADNLSSSLGYIGGFGLLSFIFLALILVKNGVPEKALILISLAYLAALFGICSLILQQIRRSAEKSTPKASNLSNDFQINQIGAASTARLEEAKQMPISITENTTRNFEKIPLKES